MSPLPAIYSQIEPLLRWNHHCPHPMDGSPQCWPSLPSLSSYTDNPSCSAPSQGTHNMRLLWTCPGTSCSFSVNFPSPSNLLQSAHPAHPENSSSTLSTSANWRRHQAI